MEKELINDQMEMIIVDPYLSAYVEALEHLSSFDKSRVGSYIIYLLLNSQGKNAQWQEENHEPHIIAIDPYLIPYMEALEHLSSFDKTKVGLYIGYLLLNSEDRNKEVVVK